MKYLISFFSILTLTWVISCSGRPGKPEVDEPASINSGEEASAARITIVRPAENAGFKLGESIIVELEPDGRGDPPDSVIIYFDGRTVATLARGLFTCTIPSEYLSSTGRKPLKVTSFRKDKARISVTRFLIIFSDKAPVQNKYKIINTYPHDRNAFTQGLFYDNGVLYEGTGQETGSSLREVELASGKIIRQLNLKPPLFGEGITLYNDRIYQVTWRSKVGFVYDKDTFSQINKIYYQSEGWGLTTMDGKIVMSDGTNVLYFIEPEMFTVISRLEVYDNEKKADQLNELEYINGEIWANMWMTDQIARIDPQSGRVIGYIDLKGILKDPDVDTSVDVLNGIAWDREGGRIFVTGKNWPKLFEIRITE